MINSTGRQKRKLRVRKKIYGTSAKPRLSVFRSNKYTYAQLIDDLHGVTIADVSKIVKVTHKGKSRVAAAFELGKKLAELAKGKKVGTVVFDRNGYRFHGRVKSLADGAREGGLKF